MRRDRVQEGEGDVGMAVIVRRFGIHCEDQGSATLWCRFGGAHGEWDQKQDAAEEEAKQAAGCGGGGAGHRRRYRLCPACQRWNSLNICCFSASVI